MRTFIALDLSDEVKKELARLENALKETNADVKWVNPDNIHLTLKFLGEVAEKKIPEINKIIDDIAASKQSFETNLFKMGAFPDLNYPRVIWVGIDKNCSEVENIASKIDETLLRIGFKKEKRDFSAHLTIGRVRSGKNKAGLKEKLTSLEVDPKTCMIDHITLFQSTLTLKGPIYTPLHVTKFSTS